MTDKQEFPGRAWVAIVEDVWRDYAQRIGPGLHFSLSETYTNVPQHLADANGTVGWACWVDSPNVRFIQEASENVDVHVVADYNFINELVRLVVTPDNEAQYQRMSADAFRDGRIKVRGDMTRVAPFQELHNEIARRTR